MEFAIANFPTCGGAMPKRRRDKAAAGGASSRRATRDDLVNYFNELWLMPPPPPPPPPPMLPADRCKLLTWQLLYLFASHASAINNFAQRCYYADIEDPPKLTSHSRHFVVALQKFCQYAGKVKYARFTCHKTQSSCKSNVSRITHSLSLSLSLSRGSSSELSVVRSQPREILTRAMVHLARARLTRLGPLRVPRVSRVRAIFRKRGRRKVDDGAVYDFLRAKIFCTPSSLPRPPSCDITC